MASETAQTTKFDVRRELVQQTSADVYVLMTCICFQGLPVLYSFSWSSACVLKTTDTVLLRKYAIMSEVYYSCSPGTLSMMYDVVCVPQAWEVS
jgi:hypothetical protein